MSTFFISDLHLDESRPGVTRAFLQLLQQLVQSPPQQPLQSPPQQPLQPSSQQPAQASSQPLQAPQQPRQASPQPLQSPQQPLQAPQQPLQSSPQPLQSSPHQPLQLSSPRQATQALYILGDFFEVWVGDDNSNPFIDQVSRALKQLTQSGIPVYIMHGNRDFLLGQHYCQQTGCQLIRDPSVIDLYSQRVLLMHGDSLCTDDSEYQAFRLQMRDPQWQHELLCKPLSERITIAGQLRKNSMNANSQKTQAIMDVTPDEVTRVMSEHNVQLMIHGHTHRPAIHSRDDGNIRIVLGDWDQQGWYLHWHEDGTYELNSFSIE